MNRNTHKIIVINSKVNIESYQFNWGITIKQIKHPQEVIQFQMESHTRASGSFKADLEVNWRAVGLQLSSWSTVNTFSLQKTGNWALWPYTTPDFSPQSWALLQCVLVYFGDALHQWLNRTQRITFLSPIALKQSSDSFRSAVCGNMCSWCSVDSAGTEVISMDLINASGLLAVVMHHCVSPSIVSRVVILSTSCWLRCLLHNLDKMLKL